MNGTTRRRRSSHAGSSRGRQSPASRMPLPTDFQTTQPSKDGVIYQFKACGRNGAIIKSRLLVTLAEKLRPSQQLGCHCHSTLILEPTAPTAGPHQALWPQQSIHIVYLYLWEESTAPWVPSPATAAVQPSAIWLFNRQKFPRALRFQATS